MRVFWSIIALLAAIGVWFVLSGQPNPTQRLAPVADDPAGSPAAPDPAPKPASAAEPAPAPNADPLGQALSQALFAPEAAAGGACTTDVRTERHQQRIDAQRTAATEWQVQAVGAECHERQRVRREAGERPGERAAGAGLQRTAAVEHGHHAAEADTAAAVAMVRRHADGEQELGRPDVR